MWVVVRFMIGQVRVSVWVVGLLDFSGYQIIFNVDFLVIGVCIVNIVGGMYDFVELLMLVIVVFLVVVVMYYLFVIIGKGFVFLFEVVKVI